MLRSSLARVARVRAMAVALAIAGVVSALVAVPLAGFGVPAARAMGPLPACRYDDILTTPRAYRSWSMTLVDTILRVPSTYIPPDLVSTAAAGIAGGGQVRQVAIADLTEMTAAAKANGSPIAVQSAYRSYAQQKVTFDHWVSVDGYSGALKVSARPGHSEHQLGLAIDFKSDAGGPPWDGTDWALSPAGAWMKANAWTYGWVLSYPKNDFAKVCYSYEPWHYRYVGRDLAKLIHESRLTVREYLWANFTTAVVPPPSAPGSPRPTVRPIPSPTATPVPSVTASPVPIATTEPTLLPTSGPTDPPATIAPTPTDAPTNASDALVAQYGRVVLSGLLVVAVVALLGGAVAARRGRGRR